MTITLKLTEKEAVTLYNHFAQNIQYGVSGTFGDGSDYNDIKEFNSAKKILEKIGKAIYKSQKVSA